MIVLLLRKACFNTWASLTQWKMQKLHHAQCRGEPFFIPVCWRSLRQSLSQHGQRAQGRNSSRSRILLVSSAVSQRQAFRLPHPACASSRQLQQTLNTGSAALVLLRWFVGRGQVREALEGEEEEAAHSHKGRVGQEVQGCPFLGMVALRESEGEGEAIGTTPLHGLIYSGGRGEEA